MAVVAGRHCSRPFAETGVSGPDIHPSHTGTVLFIHSAGRACTPLMWENTCISKAAQGFLYTPMVSCLDLLLRTRHRNTPLGSQNHFDFVGCLAAIIPSFGTTLRARVFSWSYLGQRPAQNLDRVRVFSFLYILGLEQSPRRPDAQPSCGQLCGSLPRVWASMPGAILVRRPPTKRLTNTDTG